MEINILTLNETELRERFSLEHVDCCEDCHNESDELGRSLIKVQLPEGNFVECCCNVADAFNKLNPQ